MSACASAAIGDFGFGPWCAIHGYGACDCYSQGCFPNPAAFKIPKLLCDACDEPLSPEDQAYERTLCAACKAVIKSLRTIIVE